MNDLKLPKTRQLFQQKAEHGEFDSYALYVKAGAQECTFFSDNVDQDTYFDIASCGKILVTTPLILKAIAGGKLWLGSTMDEFFEDVANDKKSITIQQLLTHTSIYMFRSRIGGKRDFISALKIQAGNGLCLFMLRHGFVGIYFRKDIRRFA